MPFTLKEPGWTSCHIELLEKTDEVKNENRSNAEKKIFISILFKLFEKLLMKMELSGSVVIILPYYNLHIDLIVR
ncbi:MAG TPA: hypothetical protein DCX92_02575 [Bacteroidetes bacterium]|nr:hypothetical protein [Bacteroidota bacterium]